MEPGQQHETFDHRNGDMNVGIEKEHDLTVRYLGSAVACGCRSARSVEPDDAGRVPLGDSSNSVSGPQTLPIASLKVGRGRSLARKCWAERACTLSPRVRDSSVAAENLDRCSVCQNLESDSVANRFERFS